MFDICILNFYFVRQGLISDSATGEQGARGHVPLPNFLPYSVHPSLQNMSIIRKENELFRYDNAVRSDYNLQVIPQMLYFIWKCLVPSPLQF